MIIKPVPIIIPQTCMVDFNHSLPEIFYMYLPATLRSTTYYQTDILAVIKHLKEHEKNQLTFKNYRSECNRLLNWVWLIKQKSVLDITSDDIKEYILFCISPPRPWICKTAIPSFIKIDGILVPNPRWLPFVRSGNLPLSQSSIKCLLVRLSSFFGKLVLDELIPNNPVQAIRQRSSFINRAVASHSPKIITQKQIDYCIKVCKNSCNKSSEIKKIYNERNLFLFTMAILIYPRTSELISDKIHQPKHSDFYKDDHGWWFKVICKGKQRKYNVERRVPVPDELIKALFRYRKALGLKSRPSENENIHLFISNRGEAISDTRTVLNIIKNIFKKARLLMIENGESDNAIELASASTKWLRNTGISRDLTYRPIEHVRDDAGHTSCETTLFYSNSFDRDRAKSKKSRNKAKK